MKTRQDSVRVVRRRGSASVEAVIVIPIYIMLLAGVVMVGHRELCNGQNAVSARYTLWAGQGGLKTSDFVHGKVGSATFSSGGRGEASSGGEGQVLNWKEIYGPQASTVGPQTFQFMTQEDQSGKGEGGELHGFLKFKTSTATVNVASIIPFAGRLAGDGSEKFKGTIQDSQYVVVAKDKPSQTIRKTEVSKAGASAIHPIEGSLGKAFSSPGY